MYLAADVITNVEQHLPWVLFWTLIAWASGFVQVVEAVRLGVRDRMPGQPIAMTIFLLAHDSTFFMHYDYWLHGVNHWYFSAYWVGMGMSVVIELFLMSHILRFARQQIAPQMSPRAFFLVIALYQACAYLVLWWVQSLLADPLYLCSLVATQVAAVVFNIPFLIARGNTKGQSQIFAWSALLGPGSLALGLFPALSPIFHNGSFAAVVVVLASLSVAYVVLLGQYRRRELASLSAGIG